MPQADNICAPYLPESRLSDIALDALPSVCRRFGIVAVRAEDSGPDTVTLDCGSAQLDALNRHVFDAGESEGDYLGHQAEAELAVRAGLAQFGDRHPATLSSLHNLANCFEAAGRLRESRCLFERVLDGRRSVLGRDAGDTLITQNDLALVVHACGDVEKARQLHEDALNRRRRVLGETHRETLSSMNNLAVALRGLGESSAARALMDKVLERRQHQFGSTHRETLMAVNNVAACRVESGDVDAACALFSRAWQGFEKLVGADHRDTLTSLHNLAWCHQTLGERRVARSLYLQLIERCRNALGERHPDTLTSERNLARFHVVCGELDEAFQIVERITAVQTEVLGRTHEDTLTSLQMLAGLGRDLGRNGWRAHAAAFFAGVVQAPRNAGTWPGLVAAAVGDLAQLAGHVPDLSASLADLSRGLLEAYDLSPSDKRKRIGSDFMRFHRRWLAFCVAEQADDIPVVLSAMHGREINALLLDNWESQSTTLPEDSPRARFCRLRHRLIDLRVQLEWLGSAPERAAIEAEHDALLGDYRRLHSEMASAHPGYLDARAAQLSAAALGQRLRSDDAVVLLFITETQTDDDAAIGCAACVTRERITVSELPELAACAALARRAARLRPGTDSAKGQRRIIGSQPNDGQAGDVPDGSQMCKAIADALWTPLGAQFSAAIRRIHIVTHDTLHILPVEQGRPEGVRTYVYPGLAFMAHRLGRRERSSTPTLPANATLAIHCDSGDAGAAIPFVGADADIVRQIWPAAFSRPPTLSVGSATQSMWQPGAAHYDVWHFACHGAEIAEPQRQTVLALGDGGYLDAAAILASGQAPTLAVLGACVVGRVRETPTGEPLGLLSGLFLAGADFVVAPVHPVPDFWMPLLMTLFYQSLAQGLDPAQALDEAKDRLATGRWYEQTADIIEQAFVAAIEQWLPDAADKPGMADVIATWHLPEDLAEDLLGPRNAVAFERLREEPGAAASIARRIVAHLVEIRESVPREVIFHLSLWVRGFGMPFGASR